jgi:fatty-acyl-CoA synthase
MVREFYGATEGNVAFMNFENKVGSVGRFPWKVFTNARIVRYDHDTDLPVRGADGLCIECGVDEVGEMLGRLPKKANDPTGRFEGYTSKEATEKKLLRDVFERGDVWFRTGDLLRQDKDDFLYFVDRIGDTFRWKGENVSTSEVAQVLSVCAGVKEANVYGVSVPAQDGRAGMAALVVQEGFDPAPLAERCTRELPAYARPIFLRLLPQIEVTGTFKHRKVELVKEGFDPSVIPDPLYFLDGERYVPLDAALHARIVRGEQRL